MYSASLAYIALIRNKNNPNFTFEDSVDGDESLFLSDIIISDWSGVAIEYNFALKKPVIFCKVSRIWNFLLHWV